MKKPKLQSVFSVAGTSFCLLFLYHVSIFFPAEYGFSLVLGLGAGLILIFAGIRMVFRKSIRPRLMILAISCSIYTAVLLLDPLPKGSYFSWFNKKQWIEGDTWAANSPTKRRLMLGSLFWIKSFGWREEDLDRNLGPSSNYFQDLAKESSLVAKVFSYRIDNEDGLLAIDSQWLVIFVNKDGRILMKKILRD